VAVEVNVTGVTDKVSEAYAVAVRSAAVPVEVIVAVTGRVAVDEATSVFVAVSVKEAEVGVGENSGFEVAVLAGTPVELGWGTEVRVGERVAVLRGFGVRVGFLVGLAESTSGLGIFSDKARAGISTRQKIARLIRKRTPSFRIIYSANYGRISEFRAGTNASRYSIKTEKRARSYRAL